MAGILRFFSRRKESIYGEIDGKESLKHGEVIVLPFTNSSNGGRHSTRFRSVASRFMRIFKRSSEIRRKEMSEEYRYTPRQLPVATSCCPNPSCCEGQLNIPQASPRDILPKMSPQEQKFITQTKPSRCCSEMSLNFRNANGGKLRHNLCRLDSRATFPPLENLYENVYMSEGNLNEICDNTHAASTNHANLPRRNTREGCVRRAKLVNFENVANIKNGGKRLLKRSASDIRPNRIRGGLASCHLTRQVGSHFGGSNSGNKRNCNGSWILATDISPCQNCATPPRHVTSAEEILPSISPIDDNLKLFRINVPTSIKCSENLEVNKFSSTNSTPNLSGQARAAPPIFLVQMPSTHSLTTLGDMEAGSHVMFLSCPSTLTQGQPECRSGIKPSREKSLTHRLPPINTKSNLEGLPLSPIPPPLAYQDYFQFSPPPQSISKVTLTNKPRRPSPLAFVNMLSSLTEDIGILSPKTPYRHNECFYNTISDTLSCISSFEYSTYSEPLHQGRKNSISELDLRNISHGKFENHFPSSGIEKDMDVNSPVEKFPYFDRKTGHFVPGYALRELGRTAHFANNKWTTRKQAK